MKRSRPVEQQIVASYTRYYTGSTNRLARLVETHIDGALRWQSGYHRPNRYMVTRMCRLLMWGACNWPDEVSVQWEAMRVSPPGTPDPFRLSETVRFGFGGPRDGGALIRSAMQRLGIERRAHMGRLLGTPPKLEGHYVMLWSNGTRKCSTRYLLRLLALLLWDWRGYPVSDMWSVDWASRTIEWSWDGQSGAPVPLPGNPFQWLELAGRRRRPQTKQGLAIEPMPVYMEPVHA